VGGVSGDPWGWAVTIQELTARIREAGREELEIFRSVLEGVGLSWAGPEIIFDRGSPARLTAEFKVEFYRDGDLVDLFEFHVVRDGAPVVSEEEVREWVRQNVPDVVEKRGLPG
jgi:hypothetical protein